MLWIVLGSIGGVTLLVILSIVGLVYWGYKEVQENTRSAAAKSNVRAIARSVQRVYDRYSYNDYSGASGVQHKLCGSAKPVPKDIPDEKYFPSSSSSGSKDFNTGDDDNGWKCLAYTQYGSIEHQYEYRVGKNYKGPSRGGPDPGPDGFEVSAEGDADGDGKTSLFTMTGKVDKVTKTLKLDYDVFVVDEDE